MAINLSGIANSIINLYGSSMTLKRATSTFNKYGDDSTTYKSETIVAGVNDLTGEEEWNKYGEFVPGDKLFFIKISVTQPNNGDIIVYNGENYELARIVRHDSGQGTHYECYGKRI